MSEKKSNLRDTEFYNSKPLKIFFSYYKPHLKIFLLDMFCAVLISLIDICFPMISKFTIDSILPEQKFKTFFILIIALLAMYLLRKGFTWVVNFWGHYFGTLVETDMRRDVFSHLEKQSFYFYDKHRTGKLMARVTTDLFEITELAHHGPEDFLISVLTLLGSFFFTAENPLGTCSHCFYFHSACNYNYDDFAFKTKRNFKKGKGNYGGD